MKILFICGSLQAGKDGVGDYTLRLARQLSLLGQKAAALSINDSFVQHCWQGEINVDGIYIPALRLSSVKQLHTNKGFVEDWLKNVDPEWCSIQFVPFAFHPKGLPYGLANKLAPLLGNRPVHIMFHELWVGLNRVSGRKEKIWGWFQQKIIEAFISRLKPLVIHTQSQVYVQHLARSGCTARQLPLFGNIPLHSSGQAAPPAGELKIILFGGIHPDSPVPDFAREIAQLSIDTQKNISLTLVGRSGGEQKNFIRHFTHHNIPVQILGEQSAIMVSKLLSGASLGLTTTPILLIEKSGSVAAMLEHGLGVICLSKPWYTSVVRTINVPAGVYVYKPGSLQQILKTATSMQHTTANQHSVLSVANRFVDDLSAINLKSSLAHIQ